MADDSNNLGGKISLDLSDFMAKTAELNRQIRIIDSGFSAIAAGMDDWSKSEDGLKARIDTLNNKIDLQKKKVENLKEQYEKVAEAKGKDSKAAQDLEIRINRETAALNKSVKELDNTKDKLTNFGKSAQEAGKGLNKFGDAAKESEGKFKGLTGELLKADFFKNIIGGAINGALAVAGFSLDAQKSINNLQNKTGATTEEMKKFKDIANDIYKQGFGESIDDIANSMAEVKQITGETGDTLKETTKNALLLRDTFGFDVKESVGAVNSLMKNFGITSKEAYTLIAQGAQNGADKNGDLIDTLNEYAPQFAKIGLSADDFTNILINGAKEGAFSMDKLADMVKEFGIRAVDGSKTTSDGFKALGLDVNKVSADMAAGGDRAKNAFNQTVNALLGMKDPLAQQQIGVQLFGVQFEDLKVKGLNSLTNISNAANKSADTLKKMNDVKYSELGNSLETLKRQLQTSFIDPLVQQILPSIQNLTNKIKEMDFGPIVSALKFILDNATTIAGAAVIIAGGFAGWNIATTIIKVVEAVKALQAAETALTVVQALLNLTMLANPLVLIITLVAALAAGIIYLWTTNEGFRNSVTSVWNTIKNTITSVVSGVVGFVKGNWAQIGLFLVNPIAGAVALLYNLNPQFRAWANGVGDAIKGGINGALNFMGDLPAKALQWGKDIINNFINGIKSMISGVANAASSVASTVASYLHHTVPDKGAMSNDDVWMKDFMINLTKGITGNEHLVTNAVANLSRNISKNLNLDNNKLNTALAGISGSTALTSKDINVINKSTNINTGGNATTAKQNIKVVVQPTLNGKVIAESTVDFDDGFQGRKLSFKGRSNGL